MKLISLALLLVFAGLGPAWSAEASPPPVLRADDLRSATEAIKAAHEREGFAGAQVASETCYGEFSRQPTWRRLDRCLTMDFVGVNLFLGPHFQDDALFKRWDEATRRLGVAPQAIGPRYLQIRRANPLQFWTYEPKPPSR